MPASPALRKLTVLRDARVAKRAKVSNSGSGRFGEGSFLEKEGDWWFGEPALEAAGKEMFTQCRSTNCCVEKLKQHLRQHRKASQLSRRQR